MILYDHIIWSLFYMFLFVYYMNHFTIVWLVYMIFLPFKMSRFSSFMLSSPAHRTSDPGNFLAPHGKCCGAAEPDGTTRTTGFFCQEHGLLMTLSSVLHSAQKELHCHKEVDVKKSFSAQQLAVREQKDILLMCCWGPDNQLFLPFQSLRIHGIST